MHWYISAQDVQRHTMHDSQPQAGFLTKKVMDPIGVTVKRSTSYKAGET